MKYSAAVDSSPGAKARVVELYVWPTGPHKSVACSD